MDRYGYVMGTIPATPGYEDRPVIGFISHVDTSPDMSGKDVKPQIIEHYDGGDIRLNDAGDDDRGRISGASALQGADAHRHGRDDAARCRQTRREWPKS